MHKKLLLALLIGSPLLAVGDRPTPNQMERDGGGSQAIEDLKDCGARCCCLGIMLGLSPVVVAGLVSGCVQKSLELVGRAPEVARNLVRKLKQKND